MPLFNVVRKRKKLSLLILAIILIVIFNFSTLSFPKLTLFNIARLPIYMVKFIFAETKALLSYHVTKRGNIRLTKENSELKQKLLDSSEATLENERLRKLLDFKKKTEFVLIPAGVIAKDAANWTKSLVVNQGRADGIEIGQLVIAPAGVVGRIFEVSKRDRKSVV